MIILFISIFIFISSQVNEFESETQKSLGQYHAELDSFRAEFGGSRNMPDIHWFQFGMGNRTKFIYKHGFLINALTADTLFRWNITKDYILPADYEVVMRTSSGEWISIKEDSSSVKVFKDSGCEEIAGTKSLVSLPDFSGYRYPSVMKVLHHEILMNILKGMPVPNIYVYQKPWRRDAAMMTMCLKATGNLGLIRDWAESLTDPYDRNNAGETEADNLGQTLYMISFFPGAKSQLINKILYEVKKFEVTDKNGTYIKGRSDFHETPVYQTKWLKWGLKAMNLPDKYNIPKLADNYSALFWWDYKDPYVTGNDADDRKNYPYLGWACDHFHGVKNSPISNRDYPLTWETNASQADYKGMAAVDSSFINARTSAPHTWHSSEIFLYLLEMKN